MAENTTITGEALVALIQDHFRKGDTPVLELFRYEVTSGFELLLSVPAGQMAFLSFNWCTFHGSVRVQLPPDTEGDVEFYECQLPTIETRGGSAKISQCRVERVVCEGRGGTLGIDGTRIEGGIRVSGAWERVSLNDQGATAPLDVCLEDLQADRLTVIRCRLGTVRLHRVELKSRFWFWDNELLSPGRMGFEMNDCVLHCDLFFDDNRLETELRFSQVRAHAATDLKNGTGNPIFRFDTCRFDGALTIEDVRFDTLHFRETLWNAVHWERLETGRLLLERPSPVRQLVFSDVKISSADAQALRYLAEALEDQGYAELAGEYRLRAAQALLV
ncbi:hypothetical protein [Flaviaesturariibacter amylovorans]|uniref:Pentapeptide repeat-containing protein n=1 Tax=Flaviaesturariibacter amylovorans TaxID=1084520 RepID=A0ABP8HK55_9BACT